MIPKFRRAPGKKLRNVTGGKLGKLQQGHGNALDMPHRCQGCSYRRQCCAARHPCRLFTPAVGHVFAEIQGSDERGQTFKRAAHSAKAQHVMGTRFWAHIPLCGQKSGLFHCFGTERRRGVRIQRVVCDVRIRLGGSLLRVEQRDIHIADLVFEGVMDGSTSSADGPRLRQHS